MFVFLLRPVCSFFYFYLFIFFRLHRLLFNDYCSSRFYLDHKFHFIFTCSDSRFYFQTNKLENITKYVKINFKAKEKIFLEMMSWFLVFHYLWYISFFEMSPLFKQYNGFKSFSSLYLNYVMDMWIGERFELM